MSTSRWLTWTPKTSIIEKGVEAEPPKPSKPSFEGFAGTPSGISQKIERAATEPEPVASVPQYPAPDDLRAWAARYERMFGSGKHNRLLAYIGQRVSCPDGLGLLLDVKLNRCMVDMGEVTADGRHWARFYRPEQIEVLQ